MTVTQKDMESMSADEVLGLIETGDLSAQEALDIERQGKNRKTLIGVLEKLIQPPESSNKHEQSELVKVVFLVNTKHNKTLYQAEQKEEVSKEDCETLLAANVIRLREE